MNKRLENALNPEYLAHVNSLCDIFEQANLSDSDQKPEWTHSDDCRMVCSPISEALIVITGRSFYDFFIATGERNLDLLPLARAIVAEKLEQTYWDGVYDDERSDDCIDGCGDGVVVVCPDDMCRGSGGCGNYSDKSCYRICPACI